MQSGSQCIFQAVNGKDSLLKKINKKLNSLPDPDIRLRVSERFGQTQARDHDTLPTRI